MSTLTVESEDLGVDVRSSDFSTLYYGDVVVSTSSRFIIEFSNDAIEEFRGHGFRYNDDGEPTSGTVTGIRAVGDGIVATWSDISLAATDIRDAARTFSTKDDMKLVRKMLSGDDVFNGGGGADRFNGFAGDDSLRGGRGADSLYGGDGDDVIQGGAGRDRLYGNDGDDTLIGGNGRDILIGKEGADVFRFNVRLDPKNMDKISGFVHAEDRIQLDDDIFDAAGAIGILSVNAFHVGTEASDSSDRIIYDRYAKAIFYDPDGTGSAEQTQFASLGNDAELAASDFQIIG